MRAMKIIKNIKLDIDKDAVWRYQEYSGKKVKKPNQNILQVTEEEISRGDSLFKPQGIYCLLKINGFLSEEEIELKDGYILRFSSSIIEQLKEVTHLLVGVVTIGSSLENKVSELFFQGEYLRALALDAVGSVAVEDFSQKVRNLARQEVIEQDFQTSRHFSPGYSGWDVSQQEVIFKIIPADKIGVKLTKGYMMLPQKSLSWVIGVGKKVSKSFSEDNYCKNCQFKSCKYRF